ncbi:MAG: ATP-binding cassette domain-containing protein [Thermoleophilia bacterium]|nr:ATP-binding cassette domain-containing protein [Thermoleophilia bacterium]
MIRLEGLRVQAGGFLLAIEGLSLEAGEYVMLLGPTASGKTVLLETVAGLRRPQSGRIWFGEREVTGEVPEKRGAGLVYQDYALFPHLTVAENIGFGLRGRRGRGGTGGTGGRADGGDRVRALAGMLGIDGLLNRYPEGLSGGEQQRVALARALAVEPEALLLDEPLSALDGPTRQELQGELKRVHQETGATILHVTHDLDEALALGDRMAVLIDGELRQVGQPQAVTREPVDVEVARLVGLTNVLAVAGMRDDTSGRRRLSLENGLEIGARVGEPRSAAGRAFAVIRAEEIEIEPASGRREAALEAASAGSAEPETVLEGVVRAVKIQSVHASLQVEVTAPAGSDPRVPLFTVHVMRPQVERLGLAAGSQVRLRIPSAAVHVCSAVSDASDRRCV